MDENPDIPSSTRNFRTELAAKIAEFAPEVFADGKIDLDTLSTLLSEDVEPGTERFGLTWPGKRMALRSAQEPTTATLRPNRGKSKDWDATQNVFIEGENLRVLKLLQKHYHSRVKVIYIDPPYNTGKDFVYTDNYKDDVETYLQWTKQVNAEGQKLATNTESEGRFHSNWLSMMYPRLKLARNLLVDEGVIFVSIDDHEVAHLRLLMDNIFGESNFVENYIWESNFRPDNSSKIERENAQHVLCYARNKSKLKGLVGAQKATEGLPSLTKSSMKPSTLRFKPEWVEFQIADGTYPAGDRGSGYVLETDLTIVEGLALSEFELTGRVIWSQPYLESQISAGTKIVIKGEGFVPYSRKVETASLAPTTLIPRDTVGDVLAGNAEIKALFGEPVFNHPKPTSLLQYLLRTVLHDDKNALVLDFFAGSASTAHAVMNLNSEDGTAHSYILVQLPEPTPEGSVARSLGYVTISELARKRIELASKKVPGSADHGFRFYELTDTNFLKWRVASDVGVEELERNLFRQATNTRCDASVDDLLTEILLKQGYSLTEQMTEMAIGGLHCRAVANRKIVAYLSAADKPTLEQLRFVVDSEPDNLVVLEDSFHGDDELKTNLAEVCKTKGVELWTV